MDGNSFNERRDFRIVKEAAAAWDSACLQFIEAHDFKNQIVISHIRRASDPTAPSFTNSYPFARELYGFTHVFAHKGEVLEIFQDRRFEPKYYFPLGDTDSERAFCALMDRFRDGLTPATVMDFGTKIALVEKWAREVSKFGIFNFLLSDSRYLYAHRSSRLFYVEHECVSQTERLKSEDLTIRLAQDANGAQRIAAIATAPLTDDEEWQTLPEARLVAFQAGERIY